MMLVTNLTPVKNHRTEVELDGEFTFVLYRDELADCGIDLGQEVDEAAYRHIMEEILPKRAKRRCVNLLKVRPYTRRQLEDKLRQGGYPDNVIAETLTCLESFGYVDDDAYAVSYVQTHLDTRGLRRIREELFQKGISREDVERALSAVCPEEAVSREEAAIAAYLVRHGYDPDQATWQDKRRLSQALYRKGFSWEHIRRTVRE